MRLAASLFLLVAASTASWAEDKVAPPGEVESVKPMWPQDMSEEEQAKWLTLPGVTDLPDYHNHKSEFSVKNEPLRKRNYWGPPLLSFILPGFDQWYEDQYVWGGAYTGLGLTGLVVANANRPDEKQSYESDEEYANRSLHGIKERRHMIGTQTYQTMGGLSAYHSFRTAVRTRQPHGEFLFLKKEESMKDILLAPFRFEFIKRPTTYIPLGIAGALYFLIAEGGPRMSDDIDDDPLQASDLIFAPGISYNAGTHEEAMFRGWLMPMVKHWGANDNWANLTTAGVFAAAHLSDANSFPLPQFLLGWHMGKVTIDNDWEIAEAVFIHTWWDVLVFLAQYQIRLNEDNDNVIASLPLTLPPLEFRF